MAENETTSEKVDRLRRGPASVKLPGTTTNINLPDRGGLLMAAAGLVEWPITLLLAGTHFGENHSHSAICRRRGRIDEGA